MKNRRQVGFITNYSSKFVDPVVEESQQFSYFQFKNCNRSNDEFSPYKNQNQQTSPYYSPRFAQKKGKFQTIVHEKKTKGVNNYCHEKESSYFIPPFQEKKQCRQKQQKIKSKVHSKNNIAEDIGGIKQKIHNIDQAIKQLETKKTLQNINNMATVTLHSKKDQFKNIKKFQSSSSSNNSSSEIAESDTEKEQTQLKKEMFIEEIFHKKLEEKMHKISPKHQPSSQSENSEKQIKLPEEIQPKTDLHIHDVMKNKGGICFDVDVKEFAKPVKDVSSPKNQENQKARKKRNINSKEQILRRRQLAKIYDKKARYEVMYQK